MAAWLLQGKLRIAKRMVTIVQRIGKMNPFFHQELEKAFEGAGENKCCSNHFKLEPRTAILYKRQIYSFSSRHDE